MRSTAESPSVDYRECPHDDLVLLGTQKGEHGENKYYRCLKCYAVLILTEDDELFLVPPAPEYRVKDSVQSAEE